MINCRKRCSFPAGKRTGNSTHDTWMKKFVCSVSRHGAKMADAYSIGDLHKARKMNSKMFYAGLYLSVIYNYDSTLTPYTTTEYTTLRDALWNIVPNSCFDLQDLNNTLAEAGTNFFLYEDNQEILTEDGEFLLL